MANHKFQPPRGTNDKFENELQVLEHVKDIVLSSARSHGYERIDLPTFEHLEVFTTTSRLSTDKCYIFPDKAKRELILRPDINASISRSVVNHFGDIPIPAKFIFCDKVFRYRHRNSREFNMAGIECYGTRGFTGITEIIFVMSDILRKLGLADKWWLEFSNLGLFSVWLDNLCSQYNLEVNVADKLHRLSLSKTRSIAANNLSFLPTKEKEQILELLYFSGPSSVAITRLNELSQKLPYLKPETEILVNFNQHLLTNGIENIQYNPNCLHGMGFYSGLTYRIKTDLFSKKLADGGNYDDFTKKLGGITMSATGLGMAIERLADTAISHGKLIIHQPISILMLSETEHPYLEYGLTARALREAGIRVEVASLPYKKWSQVIQYASLKNHSYVCKATIQSLGRTAVLCLHEVKSGNKLELTHAQLTEFLQKKLRNKH